MPFADRAEFITKLKEYYYDVVGADTADDIQGLLYNFGFDATSYYSRATIASLFERRQYTNPVTRRSLVGEPLVEICDWHGTALLQLFRRFNYFLTPLVDGETQPLLLRQPQMPEYYRRIAANTPDHLFPHCSALFLEPFVPGMPDQQRLLICPFMASDGATYNLKTLMYLFTNNRPSPVTGQPFINNELSYNFIIYNILQDCWNAPAGCPEFFYGDKAALNQLRNRESEQYNTVDKIDSLIGGADGELVRRSDRFQLNERSFPALDVFRDQIRECVCCLASCSCQPEERTVRRRVCSLVISMLGVGLSQFVISVHTLQISSSWITLANAYVCAAVTGAALCGVCGIACAQTCREYRHQQLTDREMLVTQQPQAIRSIADMITSASRHLILEESPIRQITM